MSVIAAALGVEIAIMVAWCVADPLMPTASLNPHGFETVDCEAREGGQIHLLNVVYKAMLIIYGCRISYATRDYDPRIAEARAIMLGMYFILLMGSLMAAITFIGVSARVSATVLCFTSVFGACTLVGLVILPKLGKTTLTRQEIMEGSLNTSNNTGSRTGTSSGAAVDPLELETLREKCDQLERENAALKSR